MENKKKNKAEGQTFTFQCKKNQKMQICSILSCSCHNVVILPLYGDHATLLNLDITMRCSSHYVKIKLLNVSFMSLCNCYSKNVTFTLYQFVVFTLLNIMLLNVMLLNVMLTPLCRFQLIKCSDRATLQILSH